MKKLIWTILLVTAVAFGQQGNPQGAAEGQGRGQGRGNAPRSQAKVLSNAEFDALVADPSQVLIIDVRRPDEITSNGGFPVYLSIQLGDLDKSLAWIPKDRTIITVSNHAARGGRAADLLTKNGFKVAGTIGAQTYEQAGGKLTKITPPAPRSGTPAQAQAVTNN